VNTPGHASSLQPIVSVSFPHSSLRSEKVDGTVNSPRVRVFVPPPHSNVQASHSCHGLGNEHSDGQASVLHSTLFTSVSFKVQSPPKIPPNIVRVWYLKPVPQGWLHLENAPHGETEQATGSNVGAGVGDGVGAGLGAGVGEGVGHGKSLHGIVSFVLPHSSPP
jgi:hypothetical protein